MPIRVLVKTAILIAGYAIAHFRPMMMTVLAMIFGRTP